MIVFFLSVEVKTGDIGFVGRDWETKLRTTIVDLHYQALEVLKLLPRSMREGPICTNAVDSWSLGIIVDEILCSEIPFREPYEELIGRESQIS